MLLSRLTMALRIASACLLLFSVLQSQVVALPSDLNAVVAGEASPEVMKREPAQLPANKKAGVTNKDGDETAWWVKDV